MTKCYGIALLSLAALAGCGSDMGPTANQGTQSTVLAASAGGSQYPQNAQTVQGIPLVALTNRDGSVTLINPTDQPLQNMKVWINGSYVQPVDAIDARSMLTLEPSNFYNNGGISARQDKVTVERVAVEMPGNRIIHAYGPVQR